MGEQHEPNSTLQSGSQSAPDVEHADGPSELFEPVEFIRNLKSFWKTRAAVLRKAHLYDCSPAQLQKLGLMGAWKFNFTQSTIAALPGTTYAVVRGVLLEAGPKSVADKLSDISTPLLIPFILMSTAYIVGRLCVRPEDSTKAKRNQASRAFLYLDGAYGFYPQLLMSCAAPFSFGPNPGSVAKLVTLCIFGTVSVWQLIIQLIYLRKNLFNVLGYRTFGLSDPRPAPPTLQYILSVLIVIPVVTSFLKIAFSVLVMALSGLIGIIRAIA
jgi:hypothetical protein